MAYGLKVRDTSGNTLVLTPDISNIVSAGTIATPSALNGDNTYGNDIDLPGTSSFAQADLGALASSFICNFNVSIRAVSHANWDGYLMCSYMNTTHTYYTRNESTGVMTSWTPADHSANDKWDCILSLYPIAFWDKKGSTTFTAIRLFAASSYMVYDYSASAYITAYSIYTEGVENIQYAIYLRHYKE